MTIRILIADDQQLMREGLRTILEMEEDIDVVGTVANGDEAWKASVSDPPDVILMDIQMPEMDGIEATRCIRQSHPEIIVIALTTFDDEALILRMLHAGAQTYLLKDVPADTLLHTIRASVRGEVLLQPSIASRLIAAALQGTSTETPDTPLPDDLLTEPLSPREREVLALMVEGLGNQDIAARLYLSEGTIKNHISAIYSKLSVKDRTQAVLLALRHQLHR